MAVTIHLSITPIVTETDFMGNRAGLPRTSKVLFERVAGILGCLAVVSPVHLLLDGLFFFSNITDLQKICLLIAIVYGVLPL